MESEKIKVHDLVSVIIPVYNRENTIKRAIDSVLNQTYSNIEIIVVDDGSEDNTVKIVEAYGDDRIRLLKLGKRGGANKARNVGIKNSKGGFIAFQDSDDEWLPNKLEIQLRAMEQEKTLACFSPYHLIDGNCATVIPADYDDTVKYRENLKNVLREMNVVGTPTLVIDREVFKLAGDMYFDESMTRMQDYEYVIRLAKVVDITYIDMPLLNAYRTKESVTNDEYAYYKNAIRIIRKHKDFIDCEKQVSAVLDSGISFLEFEKLIEVITELQAAVDVNSHNIIDSFLEKKFYALRNNMEKLVLQEQIISRQYELAINNLKNKKFVLYGAGEVGERAYSWFKSRGLTPDCFIVTVCDGTEYVGNVPVISIDQYANRKNPVIVCVGKEKQIELIDNLLNRGYKSFLVFRQ